MAGWELTSWLLWGQRAFCVCGVCGVRCETGGCCWGQEGSCVEHFLEAAFVLLRVPLNNKDKPLSLFEPLL